MSNRNALASSTLIIAGLAVAALLLSRFVYGLLIMTGWVGRYWKGRITARAAEIESSAIAPRFGDIRDRRISCVLYHAGERSRHTLQDDLPNCLRDHMPHLRREGRFRISRRAVAPDRAFDSSAGQLEPVLFTACSSTRIERRHALLRRARRGDRLRGTNHHLSRHRRSSACGAPADGSWPRPRLGLLRHDHVDDVFSAALRTLIPMRSEIGMADSGGRADRSKRLRIAR